MHVTSLNFRLIFCLMIFASFGVWGSLLRAQGSTTGSAPADTASDIERADELLRIRGLENCKQAVTLYKKALSKEPNNPELQLKTADAINAVMRILTNGNSVLIDATSDTPANKKIWATMGKEALELAEKGYKQRPGQAQPLSIYAEAYMFYSSSMGIIDAILNGAAGQYKKSANELIQKHPEWDGSGGHVYMGCFYMVAPWPLSDADEALEHLQKALAIAPNSKRNTYLMGVVHYRRDEYNKALSYFEKAQTAECGSPTERDFCDFMTRETQRALKLTRAKLK